MPSTKDTTTTLAKGKARKSKPVSGKVEKKKRTEKEEKKKKKKKGNKKQQKRRRNK